MQITFPPETRTILSDIRWETFEDLSEQRRGSVPRMTYDEGVLELMSPKRLHEGISRLLGRMVEIFTEVREIEIQSVKSTTFKRKDLQKAFEADESYYIHHADQVRGKDDIDLVTDPPPDLVIEVEITNSAIQIMKLFAAIGREVWRHDGNSLSMFRLRGRRYERISESIEVPGFTCEMAQRVMERRETMGETALIARFRKSISE